MDDTMGILFVFGFDESLFEVRTSSFKEAIRQAAVYTGIVKDDDAVASERTVGSCSPRATGGNDLFQKSLNGFEETDVDGIVRLFNHFSQSVITKVYWFDKEPYNISKKECE